MSSLLHRPVMPGDVLAGRRPRRRCLGAAVILACAFALAAGAQDLPGPGEGFTWYRLGDRPVSPSGFTFAPPPGGTEPTLWAATSDGPLWLDLAGGPPGLWRDLTRFAPCQKLLVLGHGADGDTLVITSGHTRRSTDGGQIFTDVYDEGYDALIETPDGLPHAGRLLVGGADDVGYSDDRGATWTSAVIPDGGTSASAGADDLLVLPPGSSHPGRVLMAGYWGVSLSDDGGATFRESTLYGLLEWRGSALAYVAATGDVVLGGRVPNAATARAWRSVDGGETWAPFPEGDRLPEGLFESGAVEGASTLGGASALIVLGLGTVYRTDDGGITWEAIGRAPEVGLDPGTFVDTAEVGPDGRLYVGLVVQGTTEGWVYRTAEIVGQPVASEPRPEEPGGLSLTVHPNPSGGAVAVAFRLAVPATVRVAFYDVRGRAVAVPAQGRYGAGRHTVPVEAGQLPPGVYVVRVTARDDDGEAHVAVRRFTLVR